MLLPSEQPRKHKAGNARDHDHQQADQQIRLYRHQEAMPTVIEMRTAIEIVRAGDRRAWRNSSETTPVELRICGSIRAIGIPVKIPLTTAMPTKVASDTTIQPVQPHCEAIS